MEITEAILEKLRSHSSRKNLRGMARFGIKTDKALGVTIPNIRKIAKGIKKDHSLALELWETGIHEARILASLVDEPGKVTSRQMDRWASDFDSWDVCDLVCSNLFDQTPFAIEKALKWRSSKKEFVKRAGFVMMAALSVHAKDLPDSVFLSFLFVIKLASDDNRNFVKKAVNWALRQIGKRNLALNKAAIAAAKDIKRLHFPSARWIASDALRELQSEKVQKRLRERP
ncbi:MAG: DNA alkylation repair protein [Nitrospira bacterium SG8_3]|nr:MAG: DNA alkylation repair protein [Nitrospira bacterium SG8_3]